MIRRAAILLAAALILTSCGGGNNAPAPRETASRSNADIGKICRSSKIRGTKAAPIAPSLPGCGLTSGVNVYEVSGVRLSQPATMDCTTAKTLEKWVRKDLKGAVGRLGGGVSELKVAAHYSCRTRNHRPGAPISEHGKGKAIDISAIGLNDGSEISVQRDWGKGRKGRILRKSHRRACKRFGTVLGPNADRAHRDHFHFDTARHQGGSYCR
ncbi:MAG: extensin family protein [Mangrovicoccus sp.]|nr:extensin family protein [Mangrovicoccus sp.]